VHVGGELPVAVGGELALPVLVAPLLQTDMRESNPKYL